MQYPGAEEHAQIAERIAAGDREAENELVRIFGPRVFAMLCARTRDRETSRDLMQDALLTIVRSLRKGQLRDAGKLAAFIHGTVKHIVQAHMRGQRTREEPLLAEPAVESCADALEASERTGLVRKALSELEATDQEILLRTLAHGQKPGAIAQALRLTPEVVRQRKMRATRKVAEFVRNAVTKQNAAATSSWRLQ